MSLRIVAIAAAWVGLAWPAEALGQTKPAEFALQAPIVLVPQAGVQRLRLPEAALAVLQSARGDDVRVFNGAGQAVPHALMRRSVQDVEKAERAGPFVIYPLQPAPARATGARVNRVQVQLDGRSVAVDLGADAAAAASAGWLVDLRQQREPLDELELAVQLPPNRPITFDVWASRDLQQWQPLALGATLYRFEGSDAPSQRRIRLSPAAELHGRFLRIAAREAPGVVLEGVNGWRSTRIDRSAHLVRLPLGEPATADATAAQWQLPFATPLAALEIRVGAENTLLPLRVLGRAQSGAPWRLSASTVAYRLADGARGLRSNPPVPLPPTSQRQLRIERSSAVTDIGAAQLRLTALVEPIELVFVASGEPPFTLLAGRAGAPNVALPVASLVPGWNANDADTLPLATVGPGTVPAIASAGGLAALVQRARDPLNRQHLLWAVLLVAVAVLGGLAWVLLRQLRKHERKPD